MSLPAGRSSVLVIDDHPFQRRTLARKLSALGVPSVLEAADGADALEHVRASAGSLALIVSDVDMPEMDGLEFLRRLAAEAPSTAVAVVSALDRSLLKSVEVMASEYGLHLVGVLEKPVTEDALRSMLVRALESRESARPREPDAGTAQLAEALRAGELVPWFQPKIDLRTAQVSGAEVLVRWQRAGVGPLPPDRFLEAVKASGLMLPMTLALAASAVRRLKELPARGLTLSLNVCPTLLDDPQFADALARTLTDAGASPQEVILEITESAAVRNQGAALENLARLRMRGFELSLDDFGTGFSALAQLVRAPVAEIKIDRSFVSRLAEGGADRLLVDSVIMLARRLGLRTVAEGIETQTELDILRELGCELGQGFLFARPMPADEWLRWMQGPPRPMWESGSKEAWVG
jgi:EAL domain-containing protein (putative c-di-GMP-specific phosphodiesterase class I)/CheY-like chemotaxis protein